MKTIELSLNHKQLNIVEDALIMFIDYLVDGDEEDRERAMKAQEAFNTIQKQAY